MSGRATRRIVLAVTGAALVGLTSWVTASAVTAPSDGVRACRTSAGYLALPSSGGHCAKGEQGLTIGRRGATGARGPAGAPGSTKALYDSNGEVVLASGSPDAHHGPTPGVTTVATISDVPAGTYLVTLTIAARNNSASLTQIECSTRSNGGAGSGASWSQTVGAYDGSVPGSSGRGTLASGSGSGWLVSPGTVTVGCLNWGATGANAFVTAGITLTPVASVRSTTG